MNNKLYICGDGIHCKSCIHAKIHFPRYKYFAMKKGDEPYRKYLLGLCDNENNNKKEADCHGKCGEFKISE